MVRILHVAFIATNTEVCGLVRSSGLIQIFIDPEQQSIYSPLPLWYTPLPL